VLDGVLGGQQSDGDKRKRNGKSREIKDDIDMECGPVAGKNGV
jgi:hypothetical protein